MENRNAVPAQKQAAVDFLQLVVSGRIDEAYRKHVDMNGKHHNPYFPAGFPALQQAMQENQVQFPNKQYTARNVLGDGDFVAVHGHIVLTPKEKEMAVVHLFRFQDNKVVEMWDCGQPLPPDSPNADGAF